MGQNYEESGDLTIWMLNKILKFQKSDLLVGKGVFISLKA